VFVFCMNNLLMSEKIREVLPRFELDSPRWQTLSLSNTLRRHVCTIWLYLWCYQSYCGVALMRKLFNRLYVRIFNFYTKNDLWMHIHSKTYHFMYKMLFSRVANEFARLLIFLYDNFFFRIYLKSLSYLW
jgi:hypothetical protein